MDVKSHTGKPLPPPMAAVWPPPNLSLERQSAFG